MMRFDFGCVTPLEARRYWFWHGSESTCMLMDGKYGSTYKFGGTNFIIP